MGLFFENTHGFRVGLSLAVPGLQSTKIEVAKNMPIPIFDLKRLKAS